MAQQLSEQQIFDRVAAHLLKQMRKSGERRFGRFHCLYRGPNNTACAIGCLIPDKLYHRSIEDEVASNLDLDILKAAGLGEVDHEFLDDLQQLHDGNKPSCWAQKLRAFAKQHNLNPALAQSEDR